MAMKIAVIVNPNAGRAGRRPDPFAFRAALSPLGAEVSFHPTRSRGDATRLAAALSGDADVIGIAGGDGTVHEVVNGILPRRTPVFVIPCGAGNDLSSLVACPRNAAQAARVIGDGMGAELDVLRFGERYCINSAGLGFEGMVNRYSQTIRRVRGHARYLIALARALRSYASTNFDIVSSTGERITGRRLMLSVGNGHRTGGAFYLTPDALPDDGLLDLCIVDPMSRIRILGLLPRSFNGSHPRHPAVRMIRAESLSIRSDGWYPMHIDGEYVDGAAGRLDVEVVPRALRILCARSGPNKLRRELVKLI